MKQYPEEDIMYNEPTLIVLCRSNGYEVKGVGIGIRGSQYPGDLREIIPAPYKYSWRHVKNVVLDIQEYGQIEN